MKKNFLRAQNPAARITRYYTFTILAAALVCAAAPASADALQAIAIAPDYTVHSVELGVPFGGAIANHPTNPNLLYVSAGNFSSHTILEVQTDTGTTRTVSPVVGNVGGLAVLNNGDLAITENMTSKTIVRARDLDADGAFLSPGEITELIAPILVDASFSGAQLAVAPAGNAANIPAGSLLVQTADGSGLSEVLVIQNPESAPGYLPAGEGWFSGFEYNGGLAFSPAGHVLAGISEFPVGRIVALVNSNGNSRIDAGESRDLAAGLPNSISDLTATADGKVVTTENSGTVRMYELPADLLGGAMEPGTVLAETNGTYLSSARADRPAASFTRGAAGPQATIYVGGFVTYPAATNLLAISPKAVPAAAKGWELLY